MTYKTEFPDFTLDVDIPEEFEDVSWHNDACPCFINRSLGLSLWIDYAKPNMRELEGSGRFMISAIDEDGCHIDGVPEHVLTNDWTEIVEYISAERCVVEPAALAKTFSTVLREWLTCEEMDQVNSLNAAELDKVVCHSHDFCDANQAMLDAMKNHNIEHSPSNQKQADLLNAAWNIAKTNGFSD